MQAVMPTPINGGTAKREEGRGAFEACGAIHRTVARDSAVRINGPTTYWGSGFTIDWENLIWPLAFRYKRISYTMIH